MVKTFANQYGYNFKERSQYEDYVDYILIKQKNAPMAESISRPPRMLTEAQLHEAMLDSVVKWLGTNANKTIDQLSNTILTMRDAAVLIKDILTDQNYFDTAYGQMVKQSRNMVKQLNSVLATAIGMVNNQTVADTLKGIVQNIVTFATSIFKRGGIIGFLGSLGVYAFSKYLVQNFNNANVIMKNIINSNFADQFGTFINTVINVATDKIPGLNFFSFLDTLNTIKELFFEVLGYIKRKLDFGRNIASAKTESLAVEPDPSGYQQDKFTTPMNTLVIDTPGDLDWYKIGQHFPNLNKEDPHEYGQSDSDMMITLANTKELDKLKKTLDRLGITWKEIGGTTGQPEIHDKV